MMRRTLSVRASSIAVRRTAKEMKDTVLYIDPVYQAVRGPIGVSVDPEVLGE
jgi:hypothetical protein